MRSGRWALVGAVLVAVTAGCSAHPGTAAVVDGRTIGQDYLEDASADLGQPPGTALSLLIAAPYFIAVAAEHGVGVTAADARAALEEAMAAQGDTTTTFGDGAVEVMQMALSAQALSLLPDGDRILSETDQVVLALDMDINPRYGEMDRTTGLVARAPLPWIVSSGG